MARRPEKTLRPVHPNVGIEVAYRRRLYALIEEMARSYAYWLRAAYRANEPAMAVMAADATPSVALQRELRRLGLQWEKNINEAAPKLAAYFSQAAWKRSDAVLKKILKDAGISVEFRLTQAVRDIIPATVAENVSLIKSIGTQFHTEVEGLVMRSVTAGRDLNTLTRDLQERYGVTRRRAELIARDQNNKVTSVLQRARQMEVGITEAVWLHSHGGKEPRKTHLANDGKRYDVAKGWFDPDPKVRRRIWPGELINCFPGSTVVEFAHDVEVGYRRWYGGQLTEIVTTSGKTFSATPNHPILTSKGWRPIGSLHQGDDVLEVCQERVDLIVSEGYEDQGVAAFSEIFDALLKSGVRRLEVALRDDFHGDGADGDVDIVLSTRPLSFGRKVGQRRDDLGLSVSSKSALNSSPAQKLLRGYLLATAAFIRRLSQSLPSPNSLSLHADAIGGATAARLSSSFDDIGGNGFTLVPVFAGKSQDAQSALMLASQITNVASVRSVAFDGHVFNLQTASGWYVVAGGIIAHNCRCVAKPVVKGFS